MKLQILLSDPADALPAMAADQALLQMMARGEKQWLDMGREVYLCQQFGVSKQQDWPMAALARLGAGLPADHAYWMLVSPVHLLLQRDSFALSQPAPLALSIDECEALRNSLNRHFEGEGLEFMPGAQGHWHLRLQSMPALATTPIGMVAGRDITSWMPQGDDAQRWRQLTNEMQMLLFSHEVNQAREARGELAANSVWLHGGGILPGTGQSLNCAVYSEDVSVKGLAILAGLRHATDTNLHAVLQDAQERAVVQSAYTNLGAGWSSVCWQALRARRLQQLDLYFSWFDRMLHVRLKPMDVYKFWRKPIALEAYFDGSDHTKKY
ncbi:hypothetical protein ACIKP9_00100 [Methylobacillus methanolivorans]|uniref:Uncharacterized protein n=1 Tax=Methylobacillus methanolivorans TaxID=1848927 RepID=A0ABW8GGX6_9PROT